LIRATDAASFVQNHETNRPVNGPATAPGPTPLNKLFTAAEVPWLAAATPTAAAACCAVTMGSVASTPAAKAALGRVRVNGGFDQRKLVRCATSIARVTSVA
jgi:hypothetical protein